MNAVEHALRGKKLATNTVQSYSTKLRVARDVVGVDTFDELVSRPHASYAKLRKHYSTDSTLKQTLTAILSGMQCTGVAPDKVPAWKKYHAAVAKKASNASDGFVTQRMSDAYVCWSKVVSTARRIADEHDTIESSMDACLLALLTMLRPKRADYGDLVIVTVKRDAKTNRLVLPPSGDATLVLTEYKTAKSRGEFSERCPEKLTAILRKSIRRWPRNHVFVSPSTGAPLNAAAFGAYVKRATSRTVGKPIGVTMLRHIYISDVATHGTHAQRKATATAMLHSVAQQKKYVMLRPDGSPMCEPSKKKKNAA